MSYLKGLSSLFIICCFTVQQTIFVRLKFKTILRGLQGFLQFWWIRLPAFTPGVSTSCRHSSKQFTPTTYSSLPSVLVCHLSLYNDFQKILQPVAERVTHTHLAAAAAAAGLVVAAAAGPVAAAAGPVVAAVAVA